MLSILIPTHNRCQILARTLQSLGQLIIPPDIQTELIVVANACTDQTNEVVAQWADRLAVPVRCVIEVEPGLNFARNRAIAEARGSILAFLDDDVWVDSNWLNALVEGFDKHGADIAGGRVVLWWEAIEKPLWFEPRLAVLLSENDQGSQVRQTLNAIGANFAFRRSVLEKIGTFKPGLDRTKDMLLGGGETDFLLRAQRAGFNILYLPDASVKHWVAPHRVSTKYMMDVATGIGISSVLMKPVQSPRQILRTVIGRCWLIFKHSVLALGSRITARRGAATYHAAMARIGLGGLEALWLRHITKSVLHPPN